MIKHHRFGVALLAILPVLALTSCPAGEKPQDGADVAVAPPTTHGGDATPAGGALTPPPATGGGWTGDVKDFNFTRFDGQPGKLSDYAGQPLVVNFWAAWCPPCKAEMPDMQAVYQAHAGQFKMIGVAVDDRQDPKSLVAAEGFGWDFVFDEGGASLHSIDAVPTTLFVDRQGNIVKRITGMASREEFESGLSLIL